MNRLPKVLTIPRLPGRLVGTEELQKDNKNDSTAESHKNTSNSEGSVESTASVSQQEVMKNAGDLGACAVSEKTNPDASNDCSSPKQKIPSHIEKNIKLLLAQNPDGIYLEKFNGAYMREYDDTLLPADFGFPDVIDLVKASSCCSMKWDDSLQQMLILPQTGI